MNIEGSPVATSDRTHIKFLLLEMHRPEPSILPSFIQDLIIEGAHREHAFFIKQPHTNLWSKAPILVSKVRLKFNPLLLVYIESNRDYSRMLLQLTNHIL